MWRSRAWRVIRLLQRSISQKRTWFTHDIAMLVTMLKHGFAPRKRMTGILVPIPKIIEPDNFGDCSGITLLSRLTKSLDLRIFDRCEQYLQYCPMQFGFTAGNADAAFVLKETIKSMFFGRNENFRSHKSCSAMSTRHASKLHKLNKLQYALSKVKVITEVWPQSTSGVYFHNGSSWWNSTRKVGFHTATITGVTHGSVQINTYNFWQYRCVRVN